jgi:hypothetical protein
VTGVVDADMGGLRLEEEDRRPEDKGIEMLADSELELDYPQAD